MVCFFAKGRVLAHLLKCSLHSHIVLLQFMVVFESFTDAC